VLDLLDRGVEVFVLVDGWGLGGAAMSLFVHSVPVHIRLLLLLLLLIILLLGALVHYLRRYEQTIRMVPGLCGGCSSQRAGDRAIALRRMEQQGAFMASSEMALFQMLGRECDDTPCTISGSGGGINYVPYTVCLASVAVAGGYTGTCGLVPIPEVEDCVV